MNTAMTKSIRMLAVLLLCVLPLSIYAADGDVFTAKTVEGIDMEFKVISESSKTCEVGSNRDRSGVWAAINDSTTGTITIPSIANDYMVIGIGREAFRYCSFLSSIIIPNSVTYIEYDAFQFCYSLASITIPNSVTSIKSLAFRDCKSLKSIIIPNSVTSIDKDTFEGCSLSSVEFHCRDITAFMFRDHESLEEVIIGDEVKNIGADAFFNCSNLKNVIFGCSLEEIQQSAFYGCSSLTNIMLPESLQYIGMTAFEECSSLTSIRLQSSVTIIGYAAFFGCKSLRKVIISDIESWLNITFNEELGFATAAGEGTNPLENGGDLYLSDGEQKITEIVIPKSVISIKNNAFTGYGALASITIPNSVTSIGGSAFSGCSGLKSIAIPNSVTSIGDYAFEGCSGLTSVFSYIANPFPISSFDTSNSLTLYVPWGTKERYLSEYGWNHFKQIVEMEPEDGTPFTVEVNGKWLNFMVTDYKKRTCQLGLGEPEEALYDAQDIAIPQEVRGLTVTAIGDNAFANCSLLSISFPGTIEAMGEHVLDSCRNLAAVQWKTDRPIPASLTVGLSNPNLLLYVKSKGYVPDGIQNVVVNGYAENIVLQDADDGNNFNCPLSFTVKTARYVHNYSMTSGYHTCQGWETIALPFDVTTITAQDGTELVPFAVWKNGEGKKPFWLYELTEEGWKEADGIKANKPYLISMPNNRYYPEEYNVKGDVTFVGNDVEVYASDNITISTYDNRKFVPNFLNNDASRSVYTLNVSNLWNNNPVSKIEGSAFLRNLRHVHPFEAYITMEGAEAPDIIPVFENGMPTSIQTVPLRNVHIHNANDSWYSLDGRKLQCKPTAKGVYIVNGSKVVIK